MSRDRRDAACVVQSASAATRWATARRPRPRTSPPTGPHASRRSARRSAVRGRPKLQAEPLSPTPAAEDSTRWSRHPRWPGPAPPLRHLAARPARCSRRANPSLASGYSTPYAHDARGESAAQVHYAPPPSVKKVGRPGRRGVARHRLSRITPVSDLPGVPSRGRLRVSSRILGLVASRTRSVAMCNLARTVSMERPAPVRRIRGCSVHAGVDRATTTEGSRPCRSAWQMVGVWCWGWICTGIRSRWGSCTLVSRSRMWRGSSTVRRRCGVSLLVWALCSD